MVTSWAGGSDRSCAFKEGVFNGYVPRLGTGRSSWNLDIREQFLVVTLHAWALVGVTGLWDLRKQFLVVTFHAEALVGVA